MGAATGLKTFALAGHQVAELVELGEVFCENKMVDSFLVFNLALGNDDNPVIVLHIQLPAFLPVGLERIAGSENVDTLIYAARE